MTSLVLKFCEVIVRMRPMSWDKDDGDPIVQKISGDSLSINDHTFTSIPWLMLTLHSLIFFEHVGVPLVENCLAGFSSSVFAYEQEQTKHSDQQLSYQCQCSFLEIYNEQITDLLDPNQRNLQIRDVKSGVYVESLTEEQVSIMKDITQLLMKGLSNRRIGATSINSESSQ